jgi:hypothetical protein
MVHANNDTSKKRWMSTDESGLQKTRRQRKTPKNHVV